MGTLWSLKRRGVPRRDPVFAPPTYEALWSLQRRGVPRRYVLREPELIDLNHFTLE